MKATRRSDDLLSDIKKYVKAQKEELEKDERYSYPSADVNINAPLALIQMGMEARMSVLKEVLKIIES